ncbi:MAG: phosphate acyltransferase PlsX [Eubacteriales bacterium]|nr:phosphate acyltransferase PlsX [Eubacteriales bacterium]
MRFAIDAMGGDLAPQAVVEGAVRSLVGLDKDVELVLFGDKGAIEDCLRAAEYSGERIKVVHTTEVIDCQEAPTMAIKRKKDSSMVRALQMTASKEADCFISAGSSGAMLAGATLIVKRIKGVKRPALAPLLPTVKGKPVMILDAGANTDCRPAYLLQFALMGKAYMEQVAGNKEPKIGLLNNGSEQEKGNELTKATYPLMKELPINFIGNFEARDLMSGDVDVVVCDGFDGNILLKTTEGVASAITSMLKVEIMEGMRTKVGGALARPAFARLKKRMDYTEYGGAPLLGINGGVIKAHGSSNSTAIMNAIYQAERLVKGNVTELIAQSVAKYAFED